MLLQQLRDSNNELVGWMRSGQHIWDGDMNWVAFLRNPEPVYGGR